MKKILFLDIDGVCNKADNFRKPHDQLEAYPIDLELMAQVKRITVETGCEIVLSSSWRHNSEAIDVVKKYIKLLDITPNMGAAKRGVEVHRWLEWHPEVDRYAIIDDNSDFLRGQPLFKTTFEQGLTYDIASKVIEHLNGVKYV